jgi:hypothetical protein
MKATAWNGSLLIAAVAAALAAGCATDRPRSAPVPEGGEKVSLTGANEVPPVATGASGSGTFWVAGDCSVKGGVAVKGMAATAAHIHVGASGTNGPVAVPLTKTEDNAFAVPKDAKLNESQCAAYRNGGTYVNVHSAAHPNGEVRAQLRGR